MSGQVRSDDFHDLKSVKDRYYNISFELQLPIRKTKLQTDNGG